MPKEKSDEKIARHDYEDCVEPHLIQMERHCYWCHRGPNDDAHKPRVKRRRE